MAKINKAKRQAELRAKLKKIEAELNELHKNLQKIKERAEKIYETFHEADTSSKIKSLREGL